MHIKVKNIDEFSPIKEEACCVLYESFNNKVLPTMGHWENLADLYISLCLAYLSFLFSFIWYNLHVFSTPPQIPVSVKMRFLFKQSLFMQEESCAKKKALDFPITWYYSLSHLPTQAAFLVLWDINYQDLFYSTFHDI